MFSVPRARRWGAVAAAGCAALASPTADAAPLPPGSGYVSLGSSYASGPLLDPTVDIGCMRSAAGFAGRIADRYRLALTDVSCSGATSGDILGDRQHVLTGQSEPPQIDAVRPDTALVTILVGGNDIGYIGALTTVSCRNAVDRAVPGPAGAVSARVCPGSPGSGTSDDAVMPSDPAAAEAGIADVVEAVRAVAPAATVVLVDYLPVFDDDATTCAVTPVTPEQAVAFRDTHAGLLAATRRAADATGALLATVPNPGPAHSACGSDPWTSGFQLPDPARGIGLPYHPTQAGMAAVADAVAAVLDGN